MRVVPINPNHKEINGTKCYSSVLEYTGKIDVAVVAVPASIVPQIISATAKKRIPFCVVISAGFREAGREGKALEENCLQIARSANVRILGPNSLGTVTNLVNLSFGTSLAKNGKIAVISQSGAIGASLLDWIMEEDVGVNSFISLGNKSDLSENDFLEYFGKDRNTAAIFLYLESFAQGRIFFEKLSRLTQKKPVVVLKPGATKSAQRAMTSHTGAMVSDAICYQTAFLQANAIDAQSLEDFFYLMKFFSMSEKFSLKNFQHGKPEIVTNAGGIGVLLSEHLRGVIPKDIRGDAKAIDYQKSFRALPRNIPALFCVITPQEVTEIEKSAQVIIDWQKSESYPVFVILPGGQKVNATHEYLKKNHVLVYDFPEDAARVYHKIKNYETRRIKNNFVFKNSVFNKIMRFNNFKKNLSHGYLDTRAAQKLSREYGLPLNDEYKLVNYDQCLTMARKIGFPVVLKVHSEKFLHKTEFGAVRLNIVNEKSLREEYQKLLSVGVPHEEPLQNTITISKQIPSSFEVIIGVKRDADFGHLLMFGMGGIYTEIMKDLSYGLIPLSRPQIITLIKKTKAYRIIEGARGLPKLYLKGVVELIEKLNSLILENQWIEELDINPLLVGKDFVKIVDLKIK